jgi:hypothetical protein
MEHARLTVDQGFGRVKRFLLSVSTPQTLAPRVAGLWREEYSTGRLVVSRLEDRSVELSLSDHPFIEIPLMRDVIAEVYRHVLSLTKAKTVTGVHAVRRTSSMAIAARTSSVESSVGSGAESGGTLVVVLRWT